MRPVDKIWWMRFSLAVVAGILSAQLGFMGWIDASTSIRALLIAIIFYISTYYTARYILKITPDQLPKRTDMIVAGMLPFLVTWFTFWVLFNTLILWSRGLI
ncbi:MAG: hypothetical protein ACE5PO_00900 [Candidatus Bathyarchaeia archaeon]